MNKKKGTKIVVISTVLFACFILIIVIASGMLSPISFSDVHYVLYDNDFAQTVFGEIIVLLITLAVTVPMIMIFALIVQMILVKKYKLDENFLDEGIAFKLAFFCAVLPVIIVMFSYAFNIVPNPIF